MLWLFFQAQAVLHTKYFPSAAFRAHLLCWWLPTSMWETAQVQTKETVLPFPRKGHREVTAQPKDSAQLRDGDLPPLSGNTRNFLTAIVSVRGQQWLVLWHGAFESFAKPCWWWCCNTQTIAFSFLHFCTGRCAVTQYIFCLLWYVFVPFCSPLINWKFTFSVQEDYTAYFAICWYSLKTIYIYTS